LFTTNPDFVIEALAPMPQSAPSACVRCHKHLLEGCSRTDGFWQSSRKNCQRGFLKARTARLPGNQSIQPPHGVKPKPAGSNHQSMQPLWTSVHRMHEESSAPSGARFESALRPPGAANREMRTSTSKPGLGWLAPSRF